MDQIINKIEKIRIEEYYTYFELQNSEKIAAKFNIPAKILFNGEELINPNQPNGKISKQDRGPIWIESIYDNFFQNAKGKYEFDTWSINHYKSTIDYENMAIIIYIHEWYIYNDSTPPQRFRIDKIFEFSFKVDSCINKKYEKTKQGYIKIKHNSIIGISSLILNGCREEEVEKCPVVFLGQHMEFGKGIKSINMIIEKNIVSKKCL